MAANKLYEQFQDAVKLPGTRRRQAQEEARELKTKTESAKRAFEAAEIDGQVSEPLFAAWQEVAGQLKLAEARAEALQDAAPGKQAAEAAVKLIEAARAEIDILQANKTEQQQKIGEIKNEYLEALARFLEAQARQRELSGMVDEAREFAPGEPPVMLRRYFYDLREFKICEALLSEVFGINNVAAFGTFQQRWPEKAGAS